MIDALTRRKPDPVARNDARRALQAGPWCWPDPKVDPAARRRARAIAGQMPALEVGDAPLVTVSPVAVTLWRLHRCGGNPGSHLDLGPRVFGTKAECEWHEAAAALPRVLPFLWASVAEARDADIRAIEVTSDARPGSGAAVSHPCAIDGESFGVSFLLALASKVIGRALPIGLAASAAIDPEGRVHPAGHVFEKVRFLVGWAPRLRRILVHPDNVAEARRASAGTDVEIVPVATGGEAVEAAFGRDLGKYLVGLGRKSASRTAIVDAFFRLSLNGRAQTVDWTPVEKAADHALRTWRKITPDNRYRLEFARAVAARRERNEGRLDPPSPEWLESLVMPNRLRVLAALAEQAAESGTPEPDSVGALVEPYLRRVTLQDAFARHLELRVAYARLLSVTGQAAEALQLVREALPGLIEREEFRDIGFSLAELYRLAAVTGSHGAFGDAERCRAIVRQRVFLSPADRHAVDLFRARAGIERGWMDVGKCEESLEAIGVSHEACVQVRGSAIRWLAWSRRKRGVGEEPDGLAWLLDGANGDGGRAGETRRTFAALVRLDNALEANDVHAAATALAELTKADPGLIGNLQNAAREAHVALAPYVACHYPD
jgi:hypothetical protein